MHACMYVCMYVCVCVCVCMYICMYVCMLKDKESIRQMPLATHRSRKCPLWEREVTGSIAGSDISKSLKWY